MKEKLKKAEEYLIGKKIERPFFTHCDFDFDDTNLFNPFNIFKNGLNGKVYCDFIKGEETIGGIGIDFSVTKNGGDVKIESTDNLMSTLAKESDFVNDVFGI